MKTVTEFDAFRLKTVLAKKTELVAGGKTAEELPAALGEAFKLEGDKLTLLLAALEVAEERQAGLKRVVVFNVEEGKSAPSGALQKGDKWFLAEFFYVPQTQPRGRGDREGGRDGKRGGRGGGRDGKRGGRGGGGGGRPERGGGGGPRGPGRDGDKPAAGGADAQGQKRRPRREPRPPQAGAQGPAGPSPKPNVKPNVKPLVAGAAAPEAATAAPKPTTENQS